MARAAIDSQNASLLPRLLMGVDALLAVCCIAFIVIFYTGGGAETKHALESGRRLIIAAKDGSITGTVRQTTRDSATADTHNTTETPVDKPAFDVGSDTDNPVAQHTDTGQTDSGTASLVATEEEAVQNIRVNPRTAASLPPAPIDGLTEPSPYGAVPTSSLTNSPFFAYARPYTPPASPRPQVAIVITGLGTQNALTDELISLPADITLAFSPYSRNAALWTESARNMGHEAWLMLPVQPAGFPANDPGPLAQLSSLSDTDNKDRLLQVLARSVGYAGLVIPPDEALSNSADKLEMLLKDVSARGLGLLTVRLSDKTQARSILNNGKQRRLVANSVLDDSLTEADIAKQLQELTALAVRKGSAVGVLRPYPVSLRAIQSWLKSNDVSTVQLVPLSALMHKE